MTNSTTTKTNDVLDWLKTPLYAELTEGKHENCTITAFVPMRHATDPSKNYVAIEFLINNRPFKRNFFSNDLPIFFSHLRRQLDRTNEDILDKVAFINDLIKDQTKFCIWVTYPNVFSNKARNEIRVQNLHFLEPIVPATIGTSSGTSTVQFETIEEEI